MANEHTPPSQPAEPAPTVPVAVVPEGSKESVVVKWWSGRSRIERYVRHIVATTIWIYTLGQLFIFDFDRWLTDHLSVWLRWIVEYKLVVFLFLSAVILNFVPRRRFWSWAVYIALYPVTRIAFFLAMTALAAAWTIFKLKSWSVLFAILNITISFYRTFKFNFLLYVVALIGVFVALISPDPNNLISASVILTVTICALVARKLVTVFRPSAIFDAYVGAIAWVMDFSRRKLIRPSNVKDVDPAEFTLQEFEKRYGNLSTAILLSELCGTLETEFRRYRKSGIAIATYLLSLAFLFSIVVILLGLANYSLFRSSSISFSIKGDSSVLMFIYYAFGAATGQRIAEIYPISTGARALSILATFLSWIFVAGTFLSLVLTIKRDRDDAEIERAIGRLQRERTLMNQFVEGEFSLRLDQAIYILENLKGGLSTFIALLRNARQPDP